MQIIKPARFAVTKVFLCAALATAVIGPTGPLRFFTPPASAQEEEDTALSKEMKGMNRDFKQLKKQLDDATKKADSLALVASMKKHALAARDLDPANAKKIPEASRGKWISDYQKEIDKLVATFDKLQAAISADKTEEAKQTLDQVMNVKREGHKEFAKEDDSRRHGPGGPPGGPGDHGGPGGPPPPPSGGPGGPGPTPAP